MADTVYTDGATLLTADTMNDLNRLHYTILGDPATGKAALTSLGNQASYAPWTTGGTDTAYTLTPTPASTANATGQRFRVTFNAASGATPTLAVSGQTAKNLKYYDSAGAKQAITSTQVPINWISDVEYDGTDWVVLDVPPTAVSSTGLNPIINGAFSINQRAAATNADDTYAHDRWNVLTQTGTIALSTLTDVEDTTPFMARLTQSQASAQRMGYSQIIEGKNCKHLRGQQVTFRFGRERLSASANIRIAVLEWTGTEDSVTSDVVLDWTSATYTAGNFFLAANLTVSGVVQQALTANTLTDGSAVTVTLGSSFNNLIVFVWTEGTVAQNVTLDLGKAQFETGATSSSFVAMDYEVEVAKCERYYQRITPEANEVFPGSAVAGSTSTGAICITFKTGFRIAPSALEQSGTAGDYRTLGVAATTCTAVPTFTSASVHAARLAFTTGATLTGGDALLFSALNATGYLGFSAEL